MSPVISIIIPVYNVENYLRPCLDSVLNQSFTDFEVICVDDCSTDGSYAILKEYEQKDSRIRVLQNQENLKAAGTRNVGLDNATGEYIYFIDADDYIDSDYLSEIHDIAQKTGADITMNLNIKTHTNNEVAKYVYPLMPPIPEEGCFIDNQTSIEKSFCVIWMRLFKRAFIEQYNIRFQHVRMTEDNVFHFTTSLHASTIFAFNGKNAYHYIIRDDSVTGVMKQINKRDYVTMKANDMIYDYLLEKGLLESCPAKLFNTYPFIKVDTEEKFELYKSYFKKIESFINAHKDMYNEMDWFFATSILTTDTLEEYMKRYSANIVIGFVKNKRRAS